MQLEPLLWIQGKKHLLDKGISEANMATPQAVDYSRIFGVHDSLQMVWVLNGNSLITTPFNNNVSPVSLDLMTCMDKEFHDAGKGNPVYLGIKNNCLCLFCGEVQGQPTLQLKVMNSARRLTQCETSHCRPDKARPRGIYFLYHRTEGVSLVLFDSSSPQQEREPYPTLGHCQSHKGGENHHGEALPLCRLGQLLGQPPWPYKVHEDLRCFLRREDTH
ncbi:interleukin-36 alpha-like isoform X1 [Panthera leo]|uniref:interleukin-36 alpha-like isoform X1 n=1 Tax=Panthera leo TaxID=9689 RepID=UPI001C6A7E3C|nr:interleukin-36 alpha-like isoform X1 [Panthera leo]